jgi:hypothetical protein
MDEKVLLEVQALKNLLGSLFGKSKAKVDVTAVSPSSIEKQAKEIIEKIIQGSKAKIEKTERKKSAEGILLRYHVSVASKRYTLKCYIVFESRYFNLTLWSGDGQSLLDVLAIGDLKQRYRLQAIGQIRLGPWAKGEK